MFIGLACAAGGHRAALVELIGGKHFALGDATPALDLLMAWSAHPTNLRLPLIKGPTKENKEVNRLTQNAIENSLYSVLC